MKVKNKIVGIIGSSIGALALVGTTIGISANVYLSSHQMKPKTLDAAMAQTIYDTIKIKIVSLNQNEPILFENLLNSKEFKNDVKQALTNALSTAGIQTSDIKDLSFNTSVDSSDSSKRDVNFSITFNDNVKLENWTGNTIFNVSHQTLNNKQPVFAPITRNLSASVAQTLFDEINSQLNYVYINKPVDFNATYLTSEMFINKVKTAIASVLKPANILPTNISSLTFNVSVDLNTNVVSVVPSISFNGVFFTNLSSVANIWDVQDASLTFQTPVRKPGLNPFLSLDNANKLYASVLTALKGIYQNNTNNITELFLNSPSIKEKIVAFVVESLTDSHIKTDDITQLQFNVVDNSGDSLYDVSFSVDFAAGVSFAANLNQSENFSVSANKLTTKKPIGFIDLRMNNEKMQKIYDIIQTQLANLKTNNVYYFTNSYLNNYSFINLINQEVTKQLKVDAREIVDSISFTINRWTDTVTAFVNFKQNISFLPDINVPNVTNNGSQEYTMAFDNLGISKVIDTYDLNKLYYKIKDLLSFTYNFNQANICNEYLNTLGNEISIKESLKNIGFNPEVFKEITFDVKSKENKVYCDTIFGDDVQLAFLNEDSLPDNCWFDLDTKSLKMSYDFNLSMVINNSRFTMLNGYIEEAIFNNFTELKKRNNLNEFSNKLNEQIVSNNILDAFKTQSGFNTTLIKDSKINFTVRENTYPQATVCYITYNYTFTNGASIFNQINTEKYNVVQSDETTMYSLKTPIILF